MNTLARAIGTLALLATGCTALIGEDFAGYASRPTLCDPRSPQDSDAQKFHRCPAGDTCLLAAADGTPSSTDTNCFPSVDPPLSPQASCANVNRCGAGLFCSDFGCAEYCTVGTPCGGGRACVAFNPPARVVDAEVGYCAFEDCDPLATTCVVTCSFYTATATACIVAVGTAARGEACATDADCKRTLACNDTACTNYCRLGAFADCPGGKACVAPATPLERRGQKYGYCAL